MQSTSAGNFKSPHGGKKRAPALRTGDALILPPCGDMKFPAEVDCIAMDNVI